ncbi:MAG: protein kinase [Aestuariibacter sp.]
MDLTRILDTNFGINLIQQIQQHEAPETLIGTEVNGYQLQSVLAQGGMSVVYLAHRIDGSFERTVAVKFLHPSLSDKENQLRFFLETKILAQLQHPNIAQLLDAGISDDGRAFVIMEYIEGVSLSDYLKRQKLNLSQRLLLFEQLLEGVKHAHQRGIIHRDIKPNNVVITKDGHLKLLDFGVAVLLSKAGIQDPAPNELRSQPLTLAYASPEMMNNNAISTRTDVFQLGLVLYQCIAGEHLLRNIPMDKLHSTLCNELPSSNIDYLDNNAEQERVSNEVNAILRRCLMLEPEQRYATAAECLRDLQHFRQHRPISALPHSSAYRMRKFIQRNRISVAVTALSLLLILSSGIWYVTHLQIAQEQANQEAKRASNVISLLNQMFEANSPFKNPSGEVTIQQLLSRTQQHIQNSNETNLSTRLQLGLILAGIHYQLGEYQQVIAILEPLVLSDSTLEMQRRILLARSLSALGRQEISINMLNSVLQYFTEQPQTDDATLQLANIQAQILMAANQRERGQIQDVISQLQSLLQEWPGEQYPYWRSMAHLQIAKAANSSDNLSLMNTHLQQAYQIQLSTFGDEYLGLAKIHELKGIAYQKQGNVTLAEQAFYQALAIWKKYPAVDKAAQASLLNTLGVFYRVTNRTNLAKQFFQQYLNSFDGLTQDNQLPPKYFHVQLNLANIREDTGDYLEAEALLKAGIAAIGHQQSALAASYFNNLGTLYRELGRYSDAIALSKEALARKQNVHGPRAVSTMRTQIGLAWAYCAQGDFTIAKPLLDEAELVFKQAYQPGMPGFAFLFEVQGICLQASGNYAQALDLLIQGRKLRIAARGLSHPYSVRNLWIQALVLEQQGELSAAHERILEAVTYLPTSTLWQQLIRATQYRLASLTDPEYHLTKEYKTLYDSAMKQQKEFPLLAAQFAASSI